MRIPPTSTLSGPTKTLGEPYFEYLVDPSRHRPSQPLKTDLSTLRKSSSSLAAYMFQRNNYNISSQIARETLKEVTDRPSIVLDDLVCSGVLRRERSKLAFSLQTLQEYLAADELVSEEPDAVRALLEKSSTRPWDQTLRFAIVRHRECDAIVRALLTEGDDVFMSKTRLCSRVVLWGGEVSIETKGSMAEVLCWMLILSWGQGVGNYYLASEAVDDLVSLIHGGVAQPEMLDSIIGMGTLGTWPATDFLPIMTKNQVLGLLAKYVMDDSHPHYGFRILTWNERLLEIGRPVIEVLMDWVRGRKSAQGRDAQKDHAVEMFLVDMCAELDEVDSLRAEARGLGLSEEALTYLWVRSSHADDVRERCLGDLSLLSVYGVLEKIREGADPEFWKRLYEVEDMDFSVWRNVVLTAHASDNRRLIEHASNGVFGRESQVLGLMCMATSGDYSSYLNLTDLIPSMEMHEIENWCYASGLYEGSDANRRGFEFIESRMTSCNDLRRIARALSFSMLHFIVEVHPDGGMSGGRRRTEPSRDAEWLQGIARRILCCDEESDIWQEVGDCHFSTSVGVEGASGRLREVVHDIVLVRGLHQNCRFDVEHLLGESLRSLNEQCPDWESGQEILGLIVSEAPWNLARHGVDIVAEISLEKLIDLHRHRKRVHDDNLLLETIRRRSVTEGVTVTQDMLNSPGLSSGGR